MVVNIKIGLSSLEVNESRRSHGANLLTPPRRDPWYKIWWEKFGDPLVRLLCFAALVSLGLGLFSGIGEHWLDPTGIMFAVVLATTVGFILEYKAARSFDILNKVSDDVLYKVVRGGSTIEVPSKELVVGDILLLTMGEEVPVDCTVLESMKFKVNEASLTGESEAVTKQPEELGIKEGTFLSCNVLKSTLVSEGTATCLVSSVGDSTIYGQTARQASEITGEKTPLTNQLDNFASFINKVAMWSASFLIIALIIKYMFWDKGYLDVNGLIKSIPDIANDLLGFLMIAVALIVVAVPEGLPMAVTTALAFGMRKMIKTNNLVKKMHAVETVGSTNLILTDKTGTLTEGIMTVVDNYTSNVEYMLLNVSHNTTAIIKPNGKVIGNPTEGALIKGAYKGKASKIASFRDTYELVDRVPFNSENKYMLSVIKYTEDSLVSLIKGAPEVVMKFCSEVSDEATKFMTQEQSKGRRLIAMAHRIDDSLDVENLSGFVLDSIASIEDPIRYDVPQAMEEARRAGITVKVVTGDNPITALEIARQAKLLAPGKHLVAMLGSDIKDQVAPLLSVDVFARTKPDDKKTLVQRFKSLGNVVAMTGDGTNDAPALNHADVGLAMGNGTAVAKEAADIILLDNSFPSIITAVKWGRSLYKNIQHFITFQSTINVVAILTVVTGPFLGVNLPLTVIQMLWVNLIMDTFAAGALASEPANDAVMLEKPRNPKEFIITKRMFKEILITGIVFYVYLMFFLLTGVSLTFFFTTFIMLNWFNLFNARVMGQDRSIFDGLFKNPIFIGIALLILGVQVLIVNYGGELFRTEPMSLDEWLKILVLTLPVILLREAYYWVSKLFKKS